MRRYRSQGEVNRRARIPSDEAISLQAGTLFEPGVFVSESGRATTSTCLNCPTEPCISFSQAERPSGVVRERVCPVDAISFDLEHRTLQIAPTCIGCGLCVARCPYDSLYLGDNWKPALGSDDFEEYHEVDHASFTHFHARLTILAPSRHPQKTVELGRIVSHLGQETSTTFYPLIASLLTVSDFPARDNASGDNSNRIDVQVYDSVQSFPVEVKSPTEAGGLVTPKAVQQALENKIVMLTRFHDTYPSRRDTTSLVAAYGYPPDRSDAAELISDIRAVFGVNIGFVDLRDLYELLWQRYVLRADLNVEGLYQLYGPLRE